MNAWPDIDGNLLYRYLQTLQMRSVGSRQRSQSVLSEFQQFMINRTPNQPLTLETLEGWVRERATCGSLRYLIESARRVDSFLDWLVNYRLLDSNPLAEARGEFGGHLAPIVRALVSPNPTAALEALRPLPRFGSHLGPQMHQHLAHMRALGHRYEREEQRLLNFDRYLQTRLDAALQSLPNQVF